MKSRRSTIPNKLYFLHLQNVPIFEQLQIEEALLRADTRNFCIVNSGSPRAIVMGISGKPDELLHVERVRQAQIPVIKRYSGGGTVIVDEETLFISFLFAKETIDVAPFPEPLLRWSGELYAKSWNIPEFHLRENDYVIGQKKCGGNAQYIRKDRWLHHTSFLWDYRESNMEYLQLPPKRPQYRLDRAHSDFLCRLKDFAPSPQTLIGQLKTELVKRLYIQEITPQELSFPPHRQASCLLSI
ncbi:MAG: lipoate--protein ligase family protein [Verrucomicrobia bacterium]|nr:lipoate--protein ligase family protein [Verrucomicrobiota bacterium]